MISDNLIDAGGHVFDPAKHLTDRDGRPVQNKKTRRFMPRSCGRRPRENSNVQTPIAPTPPGSPLPPAQPIPAAPAPDVPPPVLPSAAAPIPDVPPPVVPPVNFDDINRAAGSPAPSSPVDVLEQVSDNPTADTVIGVVQMALMLIGQEEGVLNETEKTCLRLPLIRVLKKYEIGSDVLPAEAELALAMASLIIVRIQRPKTATWFAKLKAWIGNVWFRRKGREISRDMQREVQPEQRQAA